MEPSRLGIISNFIRDRIRGWVSQILVNSVAPNRSELICDFKTLHTLMPEIDISLRDDRDPKLHYSFSSFENIRKINIQTGDKIVLQCYDREDCISIFWSDWVCPKMIISRYLYGKKIVATILFLWVLGGITCIAETADHETITRGHIYGPAAMNRIVVTLTSEPFSVTGGKVLSALLFGPEDMDVI